MHARQSGRHASTQCQRDEHNYVYIYIREDKVRWGRTHVDVNSGPKRSSEPDLDELFGHGGGSEDAGLGDDA